mmetsp:Transcript_48857/g.113243  ORF Transcript_48857/g.113243 Transcript_48857/m.113243 type:complete len:417 (+) Transcript_48857:79-1329(+)|eukprot:CAMPEP_0171107906 /NCGR_PEP_ID=MMETSP0766_2-20121228/67781_1 /TAXON_ID=439317 /ORGANISM="Gambierdiscus australes, Strain CAWD 149" /LENGTH=416 /DNA_ID=CAMNT_0011569319 /DNA_START=42 /DNA_END=1292 /DNA_ORIENTATION=-
MASGMSGKVRRSTESDEFDLANYDQARCDELAKAAFSEPFPLSQMVKLSFVVGGGKLVRQKYSDDLPKMFMAALTSIGFVDDSTAALEAGSGGKFKFQHDTGKNLKFVHVFPNISGPAAVTAGEEEEEEEEEKPASPQDVMLRCAGGDFERLLAEHVQTYGQKKRLLDIIKTRITTLENIEGKMARLELLSAEEQDLFDDVGADELREKAKALTKELQRMIDEGQLTSAEKSAFLEQLDSKLEAMEAELAKADAEGKAKKVQALTQQRDAARKTRCAVKDGPSASLPTLRHARELASLHGKLAELNRIEKASKGHYTMEELKRLGERPEIDEAISVLEARSRGWFEDDDVFRERLQACIRAGAAAKKPGAGAAAKSVAPASSRSSDGFTSVSSGARTAKSKASGPATRNAFGALDR